jgi:hypothetical protein
MSYDSESAQPSDSPRKVFHGREASVEIKGAFEFDESGDPIYFDDGGSPAGQFYDAPGTAVDRSGILTEITLTDPEASVEVQNTFGGQVMSESPHDLVEIEFTARFQDISMIEEMMDQGTQVSATNSDTFTRVSGGTTIGDRPNKAILFKVEKDGDIVNYLMNNAIFQQMGEISLAGDGAAEITGTAVCRIADRYVEDNFS